MKRSEMLVKIREKLEGKVRQEDYAKEILDTVEELGMLPPATSNAGKYLWAYWDEEESGES